MFADFWRLKFVSACILSNRLASYPLLWPCSTSAVFGWLCSEFAHGCLMVQRLLARFYFPISSNTMRPFSMSSISSSLANFKQFSQGLMSVPLKQVTFATFNLLPQALQNILFQPVKFMFSNDSHRLFAACPVGRLDIVGKIMVCIANFGAVHFCYVALKVERPRRHFAFV